MMSAALKRLARRALSQLGYDITRRKPSNADPLCEGFDRFLSESSKAGVDVNDWLETHVGWEPALPVVNRVVRPYIRETSWVCELGAGTGRHARHIAPLIPEGRLHVFDHSSWVTNFLETYFSEAHNVRIAECDGHSIRLPPDSVDLCFSNGTFIEMKLGIILLFAQEFQRILRSRGHAIFDYIDISTREGWQYLQSQSAIHHRTYTYHCGHTIDRLFGSLRFSVLERYQVGKSTYVVFEKN